MYNFRTRAGTYSCTISNEYGSDACSATLIVTTSEEEAEDWKAQLKKIIIHEHVLDEDEVDWRAGLKVSVVKLKVTPIEGREWGRAWGIACKLYCCK